MSRMTWTGTSRVDAECRSALSEFDSQEKHAKAEFAAALDHMAKRGKHPSEVNPRPPLRGVVLPIWPDAALAIFFAADSDSATLILLHVKALFVGGAGEEGPGGRVTGTPLPPLPESGWDLAAQRLDDSGW